MESRVIITIHSPGFAGRLRCGGIFLAAASLLGFACRTQAQTQSQTPAQAQVQPQPQSQEPRWATTSELGRQNLNRVAASADKIEEVLHGDIGLMVELKNWIAKEATDQGQVVVDADLTDDAVFQRLRTDVEFRSVATRLLQRYGYLTPQVNPDSAEGKEQELLIKQRAEWITQLQGEDLATQRDLEKQRMKHLQETGQICGDLSTDPTCPGGIPGQFPQQMGIPGQMGPQQPYSPYQNVPGSPAYPQVPGAGNQLEQADLGMGMMGGGLSPALAGSAYTGSGGGDSGRGGGLGAALGGMSASSGTGSAGSGQQQMPGGLGGMSAEGAAGGAGGMGGLSMGGGNPMSALGGGMEGLNGGLQAEALSSMLSGGGATAGTPGYGAMPSTAYPGMTGTYPYEMNPVYRRLEQPKMVQRPNPYYEVPSIYDMYFQAQPQPTKPERFGSGLFTYGARGSRFLPMDLPVGPDYVVGPGDMLSVDLWGGMSMRLNRVVDNEGRISLPEVGPVLVNGRTLGDVQESIQKILRTQYKDVSADVSLGRLRTIRVYVVGDVARPGAYDISSLSTPLNALFAAGGPTPDGSMRTLKHMRGNDLVQDVDVYDLLLNGVLGDMKRLENGDTVLVPPIGPEITVEGMVRRPAIYELRDEKNLSQVLGLAGGMLPTAALEHIGVQRLDAHQERTMLSLDIPSTDDSNKADIKKQLESFKIQDGDSVRLFPIAPYNQNAVYVEGNVLRPGKYSYHQGMTVTDLISSYKDMLPEPAADYAEIIRLNPPDYRPTVQSFDLAQVMTNKVPAPVLQPMDTVQIFSRFDFENPPTVSVLGDVRNPGVYRTTGQIHLADAVHVAGGLASDASTNDAQVYRFTPNGGMEILGVDLKQALAGDPVSNLLLEPRDRVLVHKNLAQADPATVYVQGEVAKPGRYPYTSNMRAGDLIRVAGGLRRSADTQSADLTRLVADQGNLSRGEHIDVPLAGALGGNPNADIPLQQGDVLTVRQLTGWDNLGAYVAVKGEVKHPGTYGIKPGEKLSSVLERAGGFSAQAYPYAGTLNRIEIRQIEDRSRAAMIQRMKEAQAGLKADAITDPQNKDQKETAYLQWQQTLDNLMANPPTGRLTVHIPQDLSRLPNTSSDIELRAGDTLIIPKKPNYVMITGQVYNATAISCHPGKSANWYLKQSGGPTQTANKKAIFVIRGDGTVIGGKGSLFAGNSMDAVLMPGDTIVVPEKALGKGLGIQTQLLIAQTAAAIASTAVIAAVYF